MPSRPPTPIFAKISDHPLLVRIRRRARSWLRQAYSSLVCASEKTARVILGIRRGRGPRGENGANLRAKTDPVLEMWTLNKLW